MQQYKIRQDGFKEIKKQMLVRALPTMIIAGAVGITIASVNSKGGASDINALAIVIPLAAGCLGWGLYRGLNRQKLLFESYTLTLTDNLIERTQLNTPTVSIYFNDLKEISKNKKGSFVIKGKERTDIIGVPAQIDNYAEFEMALNQIIPITTKKAELVLQKYRYVVSILTLGLMLCVYTVSNKTIVACSGAALAGILLWSLYEIQRSKNIDAKTKRGMWWALMVLASVISVVIMKLFF